METSNYILEKWEKWNNRNASKIDICILAGYFRVSMKKLNDYEEKAVKRITKKINKVKDDLESYLIEAVAAE